MKRTTIAIPTKGEGGIQGKRSDHFGHCTLFTLVAIHQGAIESVSTVENEDHGAGGCLKPVQMLKDHGVDSLVVGGMGGGPFKRCSEAGITVFYADLESYPDVASTVDALQGNRLGLLQNRQLCQGSAACHQPGHHHAE